MQPATAGFPFQVRAAFTSTVPGGPTERDCVPHNGLVEVRFYPSAQAPTITVDGAYQLLTVSAVDHDTGLAWSRSSGNGLDLYYANTCYSICRQDGITFAFDCLEKPH